MRVKVSATAISWKDLRRQSSSRCYHWPTKMSNEAYQTMVVLSVLILVLPILAGVAITFVGWKMSRRMPSGWQRASLRAGLIAVTITPSIYGHMGILPAIYIAFFAPGEDKLLGVVPILVVWILSFFIILIFERNLFLFVVGAIPGPFISLFVLDRIIPGNLSYMPIIWICPVLLVAGVLTGSLLVWLKTRLVRTRRGQVPP